MKRRLLIEGSILDRGISGTCRLVLELRDAMVDHPAFEVEIVRPSRSIAWLYSCRIGRAIGWVAWLLVGFPLAARPRRHDLLLSPIGVAPVLHRRRTWVMLHDLNPLVRGSNYDRGFALVWHILLFWTVTVANVRFLITSPDVERLLLRRFHICPSRLVRTKWPVGRTLRDAAAGDNEGGVRRSNSPVVLMVGATEPHKRFPMGLEAVRLARDTSGIDIRLVLVGPVGRAEDDVVHVGQLAAQAEWFRRIIGVDDVQLGDLYRESTVLLVPSLTEGYCLPIVEAQAHRCVVVHCRDRTMRETAGGWSYEADPNAASLAEAVLQALRDVGQYGDRVEMARRRALSLSWEQIVAHL